MTIDLDKATPKRIVELVTQLDRRDRFWVVSNLLHTLDYSQLEELRAEVDQELETILDEEETLEKQAKFEYKKIRENHYAYIRQWGSKRCNDYIGPMRFLPGVKYKLTNKVDNTVKTLVSLGLYREEEDIYLKIQYYTPIQEVQSYLFYSKTDEEDYPRRPQITLNKVFSQKKWEIECLETVEINVTTQTKNSALPVPTPKKPVTSEIPQQLQKLKKQAASKTTLDSRQIQKNNPLAEECLAPVQMKLPQNRRLQPLVHVKRQFVTQVVDYLKLWQEFSQAAHASQWVLMQRDDRLLLCNQQGELIVEFNITSRILTAQSARALLSWLKEVMFAASGSKLEDRQQQSTASRLLLRLQSAPLDNENQLLAYLFGL